MSTQDANALHTIAAMRMQTSVAMCKDKILRKAHHLSKAHTKYILQQLPWKEGLLKRKCKRLLALKDMQAYNVHARTCLKLAAQQRLAQPPHHHAEYPLISIVCKRSKPSISHVLACFAGPNLM